MNNIGKIYKTNSNYNQVKVKYFMYLICIPKINKDMLQNIII
jgi:restriction endonuclease S subunit